jgi:hypothetical protein
MDVATWHNSGTKNFEVAPRFLENLCSSELMTVPDPVEGNSLILNRSGIGF